MGVAWVEEVEERMGAAQISTLEVVGYGVSLASFALYNFFKIRKM